MVEQDVISTKTTAGFFSDLMVPLSVIGAVQAALLISLAEKGKDVWHAPWLLLFTLVLLMWAFIGHTSERGVFSGEFDEKRIRWAKKLYSVLTIGSMAMTVGLVVQYCSIMLP